MGLASGRSPFHCCRASIEYRNLVVISTLMSPILPFGSVTERSRSISLTLQQTAETRPDRILLDFPRPRLKPARRALGQKPRRTARQRSVNMWAPPSIPGDGDAASNSPLVAWHNQFAAAGQPIGWGSCCAAFMTDEHVRDRDFSHGNHSTAALMGARSNVTPRNAGSKWSRRLPGLQLVRTSSAIRSAARSPTQLRVCVTDEARRPPVFTAAIKL